MSRLKTYDIKLIVEKIRTINVDAMNEQNAADLALEDYKLYNQDTAIPEESQWIEEVIEVENNRKSFEF